MRSYDSTIKQVDRALYRVGKRIEILEKLKWNPKIRKAFLANWRAGNPSLPEISHPTVSLTEQREELQSIIRLSDPKHPVGSIIRETAQSFYLASRMLESCGKKSFQTYSERLYGLPKDPVGHKGISTLKAASRFLKSVGKFKLAEITPPEEVCLLPDFVVDKIKREARRVFRDVKIQVKTDAKLSAKASAGPKRIRIRSSTCFAHHDIAQLIEHELMVHTLTILNGRRQPFKVFGLNSPRTTCTQEGLAVFAEFITTSIDVNRLHRISARVKAIQMGVDGADFIEVFKFFLSEGQSEDESFNSTARIFRGGKVTGGVVFTKDQVYLKGFVEIHHFLLAALQDENYLFPHYLFAGRMRSADVPLVAELIQTGRLKAPYYEPEWVKNRSTLLAYLMSSSVMSSLGLSR